MKTPKDLNTDRKQIQSHNLASAGFIAFTRRRLDSILAEIKGVLKSEIRNEQSEIIPQM
jgi:hypothetical protein